MQYYMIGGLTIKVEADFPLTEDSFHQKFLPFRVTTPGSDIVQIYHHIGLSDFQFVPKKSNPVYRKVPWEIHHQSSSWIYLDLPSHTDQPNLHIAAVFNENHSHGDLYHQNATRFRESKQETLSLSPTDQILLARVLAYRQACYLHACGMVIRGQGVAFVGHSEAGKTTIARIFNGLGELLCDDRIIIRRWPEGFRVHGTWSHGDITDVSSGSAPLSAVFLLEQSPENNLIRLETHQAIRALPEFLIKPLVTRDWWEMSLDTIGDLACEVPIYRLKFDKSGRVVPLVLNLLT